MTKGLRCSVLSNSHRVLTRTTTERCGAVSNQLLAPRRTLTTADVPVEEVEIPTAWGGRLAGRLWGGTHARPVLALHGWQDNAGTWDAAAPALARTRPVLALDFPGHGLSSWLPKGFHYYTWDFAHLIMHVKNYFKWDKVSILGHSMGAIAGMRFACMFPDEVDFHVAVDGLVYDNYDLTSTVENLPKTLLKLQTAQSRLGTQPPCYTLEEIIELWHVSTDKSVALESVPHLTKRGTKQSPTEPNKYYISRDPRLKTLVFTPEDKPFLKGFYSRLKCPTLYIKGEESPYAVDQYSEDMREHVARSNRLFEWHVVPGTHHVHLNHPERVVPMITAFLIKHKFMTK